MSASNPNPPGDFDVRLQFLLKSIESHDEQIGKLVEASGNHVAELADLRKTSAENSKQTADLVTATAALLLISHSHKERLDKLDGGNPQ
jgi:hypothetical protein